MFEHHFVQHTRSWDGCASNADESLFGSSSLENAGRCKAEIRNNYFGNCTTKKEKGREVLLPPYHRPPHCPSLTPPLLELHLN